MSAVAIHDGQWIYLGWEITADYGHPSPAHVWCATSPDFDVDCIDGRFVPFGGYVHAATREELIAEIDDYIEENEQ